MLVLQDVDSITVSTESTSILTDATLIGVKKTRAMAEWAERRGFQTSIQERLFDADFRRRPDEPAVALCGLDNEIGRANVCTPVTNAHLVCSILLEKNKLTIIK